MIQRHTGAASIDEQSFLTLMLTPAERKLTDNIPSTGIGKFDAEYDAATGRIIITVRPFLHFEGNWTAIEEQSFTADFIQQTTSMWSGKMAMTCQKAGFTNLRADVEIQVVMAAVAAGAHFNVAINEVKAGDTYIGREQYGNAAAQSTGQFAKADAPVRAHESKGTRCSMAMHDADRLSRLLAQHNVNPVRFDWNNDLKTASQQSLAAFVQSVERSNLPGSTPMPLIVTGFSERTERLPGRKDYARERATKTGAALAGLTKNPRVTRTIKQEIAGLTTGITQNLALGKDAGGYRPGGPLHQEAQEELRQVKSTQNSARAEIAPDKQFAQSYAGDPYSILAHEFGHMLGNPDEYFEYGAATLDHRVQQLLASGDPDKVYEAQKLQEKEAAGKITKTTGDRADIQENYALLVQSAGMDIPTFGPKTSSIMSAGADLLPRHFVTIWEALGRITSPTIDKSDWEIG